LRPTAEPLIVYEGGSDFSRILDELDQVDPNSAEGQKYTAVFDTLQNNCK
jgi:hypothetical protein